MGYIVVFQLSVIFQIQTVAWFALQILPGFFMEYCTGLKWFKREYLLLQILYLSLSKCF